MSWGLGWKRSTEVFHLTLSYGQDADTLDDVSPTPSLSSSTSSSLSGSSPTSQDAATAVNAKSNQDQLGFRIDLDWNAADDEDQVALKLQSQVMVALPTPQDTVEIEFTEIVNPEGDLENNGDERMAAVGLKMRVVDT